MAPKCPTFPPVILSWQCTRCSPKSADDGRTTPLLCISCLDAITELVYHAFKPVLESADKETAKKTGFVLDVVDRHQDFKDISLLISQFGFEAIAKEVEELLLAGVFQSHELAAAYFPRLHRPKHDMEGVESAAVSVPTLFPANIPFSAQYEIMHTLQRSLERVCYAFAFVDTNMRKRLDARGWACAESVQLLQWMDEFSKSPTSFVGRGDWDLLKMLFKSVAEIQQATEGRKPNSPAGLEKFITDANTLSELLNVGGQHSNVIKKLLDYVQVAFADGDEHTRSVRSNLDTELSRIAGERERLDVEEREVNAESKAQVEEYYADIGRRLTADVARLSYATSAPQVEHDESMMSFTDELGVQTPPEEE